MNVKYLEKDQNWQDETTIYWFDVCGYDRGTNRELNARYGIAERGAESRIMDSDGMPLVAGDMEYIAVSKYAIVTDEMRNA